MPEEYKIPLVKDVLRIKPVFVLKGRFYYGIPLKMEDMPLDSLGSQLNEELGEELLFRGVVGNRLDHILATGHDIPGKKKGDTTFASLAIEEAFLYVNNREGYTDRFRIDKSNQQMTSDATIMLYSPNLLKPIFPQIKACTEARFLAEPLEALKGVLLLKHKRIKNKWK